ncbi:MAG TPA: glycosyltransferase family 2 protein [Tepidisphaeraceae bacterium]|jgi:glycosyltransferase involved in cell wall biosynthesis
MPSVSIVIPTKNRGGLLMQTLASVRAQTYGDWEAIVVDDHSTDDTLVRLQQAVLDDERIRYLTIPKPRHGAQAARNLGLEDATGQYVMLLDSDDLLAPHCLQQRVTVMEADASLDFAVFPCECFCHEPGDTKFLWNVPTAEADLLRFYKGDVPWQTTSPLWRREAMARLLPWPEDVPIAQDWEFHIRALLSGMKYKITGRIDHYWRQAESERDSIGKNTLRPEMLSARVKVNERVLKAVQAAGHLNHAARDAFAGLFFQSAERLGTRVSWRDGLATWAKAHALGVIDRKQFKQGRNYFYLYRFKHLRGLYRQRLERKWPAAFFAKRSSTYLRSPVPAEAV